MEMHRKQLRLRRATQARTALLEPLVTAQREIIVAALLNSYVCMSTQGPTAAPGQNTEVNVPRWERREWKQPLQQGKDLFCFASSVFLKMATETMWKMQIKSNQMMGKEWLNECKAHWFRDGTCTEVTFCRRVCFDPEFRTKSVGRVCNSDPIELNGSFTFGIEKKRSVLWVLMTENSQPHLNQAE